MTDGRMVDDESISIGVGLEGDEDVGKGLGAGVRVEGTRNEVLGVREEGLGIYCWEWGSDGATACERG